MDRLLSGPGLSGLILFLLFSFLAFFSGCTAPAESSNDPAEPERDPAQALAEGDYSTAIMVWTEALNQSPGDEKLCYNLGLAYYAMAEALVAGVEEGGNPSSAFLDAGKYFRLAAEGGYPGAILMRARALFMGGAYEKAHSVVQIHLESQPNDAPALMLSGQAALIVAQMGGDRSSAENEGSSWIDAAQEDFRKALEIDPRLHESYLGLGDSYLLLGEKPAAVEYYLQGIAQCPGASTLHERLLALAGQAYGPDPDGLIAFYETRIGHDNEPDGPQGTALCWWFKGCWHQNKGNLHYSVEEYDLASKAYKTYIDCLMRSAATWPDFQADADAFAAAGHLSEGWCFLKLENFDEAEKALFKALPYYPEDPNMILAIDTLGYEISRSAGYIAALGFFERLTSLYDQRHQWWNDYGFFSLETNMRSPGPAERFEKTYKIFQRALELKPEYPRYVNDSAMLIDYYLDPEGLRKEEVENLYIKAWKMGKEAYENPFTDEKEKEVMFGAFTDALVNLTRLYLKEGRLEESRHTLTELLAASPDRREAVLLGATLDALARKGDADLNLEDYFEALLEMAQEHMAADQIRECLSVVQELITVDPEHPEVVALIQKLNAAFAEQSSRSEDESANE